MKKYFYLILFLFSLIILTICSAIVSIANDEIVGTVNGKNIYLSEFNRLYNSQKYKLDSTIKDSEKELKEKLVNQLVDKILILQEAEERNIQLPEEEITKRLEVIKDKKGGEEKFIAFLQENNATIEDAKNEIKNQILHNLVINSFTNESTSNQTFKSYFTEKRKNADIVIFTSKIFESSEGPSHVSATIRTKEYPTLTKSKVDEIKKLEEETNKIIDSQIRHKEDIVIEEEVIDKSPHKTNEKTIDSKSKIQEAKKEGEINIEDIEEPTVLRPITKESTKGWREKISKELKFNPLDGIKNKLHKRRLAKNAESELRKIQESIVPGKSITIKHETKFTKNKRIVQVPAEPPPKPQENSIELSLLPNDENESYSELILLPNEDNEAIDSNEDPFKAPITGQALEQTNFSQELEELIRRIEQRKVTLSK